MNSPEKAGATDPFSRLPLPRKIIDTLRIAHAAGKIEAPDALIQYLQKASEKIDAKTAAAETHIISLLIRRFTDDVSKISFADAFNRFSTILGSILESNLTFSATIPVALKFSDTAKLEPIASGVLIQIRDRTFLLTAAHVLDHQEQGSLTIPGKRGFIPVTGTYSSMKLPPSGRRADDKLDVGYFWLDDHCLGELHPDCRILGRDDVSLDSIPNQPTTYTFTGFPRGKSKVRESAIETEFSSFSGPEASSEEYKKLGLDPRYHIAMRCNRKRAFSFKLNKTITSPHPGGMSGGGVYAWNEEMISISAIRLPLVGIATAFLPTERLLVATRLWVFVDCIFQNQPDLALDADD